MDFYQNTKERYMMKQRGYWPQVSTVIKFLITSIKHCLILIVKISWKIISSSGFSVCIINLTCTLHTAHWHPTKMYPFSIPLPTESSSHHHTQMEVFDLLTTVAGYSLVISISSNGWYLQPHGRIFFFFYGIDKENSE